MIRLGTLSVADIVEDLGVDPKTVREWIKTGKLKGSKTSNRLGYSVEYDDYYEFLETMPLYMRIHNKDDVWRAKKELCEDLLIGMYEAQKKFLLEDHGPVYSDGWNDCMMVLDGLIKRNIVDTA